MGKVYNWDGRRRSSQVLAIVKERYWGLPWYWPKVVVLDGSYPCDIATEEGQDYLVSGEKWLYGVLGVAVCSRTQPLKTAQVDLRTLDGSHCSAPGGTIIGRVHEGYDEFHHGLAVRSALLTFRDQDGQTYQTRSDEEGIYELQHLPAGTYSLSSQFSQTQYLAGGFSVQNALCSEAEVLLADYDISGRFMPGLSYRVTLRLVATDSSNFLEHGALQRDGKFYFKNIPDGEYVLSASSPLQGEGNDLYYPGTNDRRKATAIRIVNHKLVRPKTLDFNPEMLPYVPIPVALDIPEQNPRYAWNVELANTSNMVYDTERWIAGEKSLLLYGLRGQSYNVQLRGYPDYRTGDQDCYPDNVPITAQPGMAVVHISVPASCR